MIVFIVIIILGLAVISRADVLPITLSEYIFDTTADDLVKQDFNIEGKTTELCKCMMPEWDKTGQDNKRARVQWLVVTKEFDELKGMRAFRVAVRYGDYPEIYKAYKELPDETKKQGFWENKKLTERNLWVSQYWDSL